MSNKKQTAVDFAFEKLAKQGLLVTKDYQMLVAYHEAKAMEKEQMINAILDNRNNTSQVTFKDAEQYYIETYGE
jgi:hypothetical protein